MKKYFLDEKYKRFTRRVCIVLSLIAGIIGLIVAPFVFDLVLSDEVSGSLFFGILCAGVVWILYGTLRWVLKSLPYE